MRNRKLLSALMSLALLCAALFCPAMAAEESVQDMMGREITLTAPFTRVVALTASDCEVLYALGAGDTLVGRGEECDYPAEALSLPAVESAANMNLEQIIALEPQVLFMNIMAQTKEQVAALEAAGIQVAASNPRTIEEVYDYITLLGRLMGRETEAKTIVDDMHMTFDELAGTLKDYAGKTVYFEISPLDFGLWTAGNGTFMNDITNMLGLENCFADVDGWAEISQEQVIERSPDYIVTLSGYAGTYSSPEEEILSRPGWESVNAVKKAAILNLIGDELTRPGPRLTEGARQLAEFIQKP